MTLREIHTRISEIIKHSFHCFARIICIEEFNACKLFANFPTENGNRTPSELQDLFSQISIWISEFFTNSEGSYCVKYNGSATFLKFSQLLDCSNVKRTREIFNPFYANAPFLYPGFYHVFRGCKNGILVWNGLRTDCSKLYDINQNQQAILINRQNAWHWIEARGKGR